MRRVLLVLAILLPLLLVGCVSMALPKVSSREVSMPAQPDIATMSSSREAWEARRPELEQLFQSEVFGPYPAEVVSEVLDRRVIDANAYEGRGVLEDWHLSMAGFETYVATVRPNGIDGPVPTIIMQMFCGTRAALGGHEEMRQMPGARNCDGSSWMTVPMLWVFGEHIAEPPVADILDAGYAVAFVFAGDIVPDSASRAAAPLERLIPEGDGGAIAAWAWVYSRVIDVLDEAPEFDETRTAVWGHSRNGKSALLVAAFDERVDLVIAHQAGTGGTTLSRSHNGESIAQVTEGYPHWFAPNYASYAGREDQLPVDQHQLIAMMAPRPLMIGGAWRDAWSDPAGSFRAARAANPVYALYGSEGMTQTSLGDFQPDADIAQFMRRGLHGVRPGDWRAFLDFLDAHFEPERRPAQ